MEIDPQEIKQPLRKIVIKRPKHLYGYNGEPISEAITPDELPLDYVSDFDLFIDEFVECIKESKNPVDFTLDNESDLTIEQCGKLCEEIKEEFLRQNS